MSYLPMFSPREYRGTLGDPLRRDVQGLPFASFGTGLRGLGWMLMASGGGLLGVIGYSFITLDPLLRKEQVPSYIAITAMMLAVFLFGLWMVRWRYTLSDGMLVRRGLIFTRRFSVAGLFDSAKATPITISPHGYFKMKKPRGTLYINFQYAKGMVPMLELAFSAADKQKREREYPAGEPVPAPVEHPSSRNVAEAAADVGSPIFSPGDVCEIREDGCEPSIYESILMALGPDGRLPEGFCPQGEEEGSVRYAPGAKDGIAMCHMGWRQASSVAAVNKLLSLLRDNAGEDAIITLLHQERTVSLTDELQRRIRFATAGADRGTLFFRARHWAAKGRDTELVKLGLAILGAMNTAYDEECREILYTLGLCDEFTWFVLDSVRGWYDSNEVVFELAQRLDGWGKVHAVKMLQADSAEISDWFTCHGCDRDGAIYNSYIALDCAQKPDMPAYLQREVLSQPR